MAETLKEKTAKGLFWGAMNNGAMQVIGLVFGIILGRLLSKEDYGMMAMINVFPLIAIALQNSGFASAIGNLKNPTANDYNSVFWFNILVGGSLYAILFFCAPFIADPARASPRPVSAAERILRAISPVQIHPMTIALPPLAQDYAVEGQKEQCEKSAAGAFCSRLRLYFA